MTDCNDLYERRYGEAMDPDNPQDALAEKARLAVLTSLEGFISDMTTTESITSVTSGSFLALTQFMRLYCKTDRGLVVALVDLAPWAVDSARTQDGLPPLADVQ